MKHRLLKNWMHNRYYIACREIPGIKNISAIVPKAFNGPSVRDGDRNIIKALLRNLTRSAMQINRIP